ncbi:hypothetical protein B0H21DRAFT_138175 [Amylocystis lapponica]|nr:hypothetical protein B0H21DRAFT_138175 [Amylocystis lapponica]
MNQSQGPDVVQVHPRGLNGSAYASASSPIAFPGQLVYSSNVTPYGSSSLSGANAIPSTSALTFAASLSADLKRKQSEDVSLSSAQRKRRTAAVVQNEPMANGDEWSGEDGADREEPDVGPNGGPKHWTDYEKNRLFRWMLCDDQHWDMFRSKMNTVFRDVSILRQSSLVSLPRPADSNGILT